MPGPVWLRLSVRHRGAGWSPGRHRRLLYHPLTESRAPGLGWRPERIQESGIHSVEANQHDQLDDLVFVIGRGQRLPRLLRGAVVDTEIVNQVQYCGISG